LACRVSKKPSAPALGRTSGAELDVNELVTTLDENTANALKWQVEMWHEVGSIQDRARLDATEYGILRGIVSV
jgi:hypothetical protein